MAIKNRYEYLSGILEALDVEHTEAEVHNNEVWRSKVLDGMGVEHTYDDINQTDLWRAKVVEGINAMSGGGGGGNPNTVETVTGTLANPFGDIDVAELLTALVNKEATGYLTINASALGAGTINTLLMSNPEFETIYSSGAVISTSVETSSAYYTVWDLSKELENAEMLSGGNIVNIVQYQDNIPTSLTVVWHPLP